MTGSTPVVNITFHRSEVPEDPSHSGVYDDLVKSLLFLLSSPNCSAAPSTAAALDTVDFSWILVLLKGSVFLSPWFSPSRFRENVCLKDVCHLLSLSALVATSRIIHRSSNLLYFLIKP